MQKPRGRLETPLKQNLPPWRNSHTGSGLGKYFDKVAEFRYSSTVYFGIFPLSNWHLGSDLINSFHGSDFAYDHIGDFAYHIDDFAYCNTLIFLITTTTIRLIYCSFFHLVSCCRSQSSARGVVRQCLEPDYIGFNEDDGDDAIDYDADDHCEVYGEDDAEVDGHRLNAPDHHIGIGVGDW